MALVGDGKDASEDVKLEMMIKMERAVVGLELRRFIIGFIRSGLFPVENEGWREAVRDS